MQDALLWLTDREIPFMYFVSSCHLFEQGPFPQDTASSGSLVPDTLEQIQVLANAGVEIGAHARNYADLSQITKSSQMYLEIAGRPRRP